MTQNKIMELAGMLQDSEGFEIELSQVAGLLQETIQKKYLQKIYAAARDQRDSVVQSPPREVTLLKAMRAFVRDSEKNALDQMIQMLLLANTVQHIQQDVSAYSDGSQRLIARSNEGKETAPPVSPEGARLLGLLMTLSLKDVL